MSSAIGGIEFLARSEHRVTALRTLREGPSDRDDLRSPTDASEATVARLLNEFEDRNWIVRDGHEYELTDLGAFVADEFLRLVDRMETEYALRDVWQWFPAELPRCTVSLFVGADISVPEAYSPYQPLDHFVDLLASAETARGFSKRSLKPASYEIYMQDAIDGTETELVFPSIVVENMLTVVSEALIREAVDSAHFTVLEHDSLPTDAALVLFDGRLALYPRDRQGVTQASIDTDRPEVVAWGESIYEEVRSEARSVDLLEQLDGET